MRIGKHWEMTGLIRPSAIIALAILIPIVAAGVRPVQASSFRVHTPILIDGNNAFTQANGVTGGSGTSSDPYIISGWHIDAGSGTGIDIRNTDSTTFFVIRGVFITGAVGSNAGIRIENLVADGSNFEDPNNIFNGVVDSTLSDDAHGVVLSAVANVKVQGVNVHDGGSGIECTNIALFNIVRGNMVVDSTYGVLLDGCLYMDLFFNTFSNVRFGLLETAVGASGIDAEHNTVQSPMAFTVNNSHSGIFSNNVIFWGAGIGSSAFKYGVSIASSSGISIDSNTITNTGLADFQSGPAGVVVSSCKSDTVTSVGICDNAIVGNTINVDNGYGVALLAGAAGPSQFGDQISVYHNNFVNNRVQALDLNPGAGLNRWDSGYPSGGNFWSDYPGVDKCSGPLQNICPSPDGIGDTPYTFNFNQDNYPLIRPFTG